LSYVLRKPGYIVVIQDLHFCNSAYTSVTGGAGPPQRDYISVRVGRPCKGKIKKLKRRKIILDFFSRLCYNMFERLEIMAYTKWQKKCIERGLCPHCGKEKPPEKRERLVCKSCRVEIAKNSKIKQYEDRQRTLDYYGHICECCGEDRDAFLAIDHMPGTPRLPDQANLTQWLIRNEFPKGFRVLCHNCNMATRWGRVCPHQQTNEGWINECRICGTKITGSLKVRNLMVCGKCYITLETLMDPECRRRIVEEFD
jgi:hypothetical protein